MSMIHVSRDLVLSSVAVLSPLAGRQRRPLRSLIELIYGLNSLSANQESFRYNHGFPKPSIAERELERIQSLCNQASGIRNSERLLKRIRHLKDQNSDSYALLLFQSAASLNEQHPESVINDEATSLHLENLASADPLAVAAFADRALVRLRPLVQDGRGGARNSGALIDREVVFELGIIFERVTGRPPGITYDPVTGQYTGPFVRFAQLFFEDLKRPINGRQIYWLYQALDVPEWNERRKLQRHAGTSSPVAASTQ